MDESKAQAVRLRMLQAHETLKEAQALREQDLWRGVINRSYYAVLSLAASTEVVVSKHTHAIAFFDKEFIKKEIFPKELSRALHYGFDERQTSDYGEIWDIDHSEAEMALSGAKMFVKAIDKYLKGE
ncbi:MAG TPA: HEPN domain-containing protein [Anaerolineales bacterium]|nr:HEPN domain-containing protein [Anaerolineales bacterium]